jgi:hypothetical protein
MALTNAEKQRRWRAAHADRRRKVQRIATLLMRSRVTGRVHKVAVGWYETNIDEHFFQLADATIDVLGTEKAISQLKSALWYFLAQRQSARRNRNWHERSGRERWLRDHPDKTVKDYRRWRHTEQQNEQAVAWLLDG